MIKVFFNMELVTTAHTLADAINEVRKTWSDNTDNEEGQMYAFKLDGGPVVATMLADECDADIAHTLYADGTKESHRCTFSGGKVAVVAI